MKIRDVDSLPDGTQMFWTEPMVVGKQLKNDDGNLKKKRKRKKKKKKRATFNPFLVQRFFAQYICDDQIEPLPIKKLIYNLVYDAVILAAYALNVLTMRDKKGEGYNFISRLRFWVTVYVFPLYVVAITVTLMIFRGDLVRYYRSIDAILSDLDRMNVPYIDQLNFYELYADYAIIFVSAVVVFVYDITRAGARYSVYFWFVNYVPPLCAITYVITILYYSICCDQIFRAINRFLRSHCHDDDLTSHERLLLCKKNVRPSQLLDAVPAQREGPNEARDVETTEAWQRLMASRNLWSTGEKIFILHDETCDIARRINNVSGYELLIFIGCAAVNLLSLVYDTCLDLVMISRGTPTMARSFHATTYWPTVYAVMLVNVVRWSSRVMGNANQTKYYLHKLRNIYPRLDDHAEVFSLQLVHQNMELSAARFFVLDRTVITLAVFLKAPGYPL